MIQKYKLEDETKSWISIDIKYKMKKKKSLTIITRNYFNSENAVSFLGLCEILGKKGGCSKLLVNRFSEIRVNLFHASV